MSLLKKYWWCCFLAFIIIPPTLNVILLIPAFIPIVGDNTVWLPFLGSLIGAIASFAMIFVTTKTLEQNKQQLEEMKRQWKEEHSPFLSCQLIQSSDYFKLRIINSSKVVADKVLINIENHTSEKNILYFDKLKDYLYNQSFVIPPNESIYFNIWITAFKDLDNLPKGYIKVSLKTEATDFGICCLYPSDFAFCSFENENFVLPIVKAVSNVGKIIENKRYIFK